MAIGYANYKAWVNTTQKLYGTTYTISRSIPIKSRKHDFIPLIKCMPNICKWLGLGKMVRRNKRRV